VLGAETKLDECAGIGQALGLPAVVLLILTHGVFGALVPRTRRIAIEIFFTDERSLDVAAPVAVDFLLAVALPSSAAEERSLVRFAGRLVRNRRCRQRATQRDNQDYRDEP